MYIVLLKFRRSGIGPVSYTHLDVYKRQVLASPVEILAKKKVKTEKGTIIKGRNQCFTFRKLKLKKIKVKYSKKKIAKAKLKKDVNLGAYIPVSYTHLWIPINSKMYIKKQPVKHIPVLIRILKNL